MIGLENYFLIILALIWIIIAVVQDFRKHEVSNWWNFSLIAIAFVYRAFASIFMNNYLYFLYGLIGFAIFLGLAYIFYYGRIFAGGDAKLLMALGAILPFSNIISENITIFIYFICLVIIAGSIYGLGYSVVLAFSKRKSFCIEFKRQARKNRKIMKIYLIFLIICFVIIFILKDFFFLWLILILLLFPFLYIYAKTIEESCMVKSRKSKELTLGDWLYKKVKVGRKIIKPDWEGLSEKELKILKNYKGKVLVKEGIPFTPAFLISFIILIWIIDRGMLGWFYNLGI